jgi:hypothetical protein
MLRWRQLEERSAGDRRFTAADDRPTCQQVVSSDATRGLTSHQRLEGSLAAAVVAVVVKGTSIVRVHQVQATFRAVRMTAANLVPPPPGRHRVVWTSRPLG